MCVVWLWTVCRYALGIRSQSGHAGHRAFRRARLWCLDRALTSAARCVICRNRQLMFHLAASAPLAARGRLCAVAAVAADLGVLAVARVQRDGGPAGAAPRPAARCWPAPPPAPDSPANINVMQHETRADHVPFLISRSLRFDHATMGDEMFASALRYIDAQLGCIAVQTAVWRKYPPAGPSLEYIAQSCSFTSFGGPGRAVRPSKSNPGGVDEPKHCLEDATMQLEARTLCNWEATGGRMPPNFQKIGDMETSADGGSEAAAFCKMQVSTGDL